MKELLQQALDAVTASYVNHPLSDALREAIAAPPAAPAPASPADMAHYDAIAANYRAAPDVREPLTREAIDAIWSGMGSFTDRQSDWRLFARAIEKAHGIGGGNG